MHPVILATLLGSMNARQRRRYAEIRDAYVELRNEVIDLPGAYTDAQVSKRLQSTLDPRRIKEA